MKRKFWVICVITFVSTMCRLGTSVAHADEVNDNRLILVSLGDSYSSGEGIPPFYGQELALEEKVNCVDWVAHRSTQSWSGQLVLDSSKGQMNQYKIDNDENNSESDICWYFVAASGAETKHLFEPQKNKISIGGIEKTSSIPAQLKVFDSIDKNATDYVTVTLGGNDAGFADIITGCALGSTYLNFSGLTNRLNHTWDYFFAENGIKSNLKKSYEAIAEKAGEQAIIIVAGYPKLLDEKGFLISSEEAQIVNQSVSRFNEEINSIVNSCQKEGMNIEFVDVEEAFEGHEAFSSVPYINGIEFRKSEDISSKNPISAYSIHPNDIGAMVYAKCVQNKINEIEGIDSVFFQNYSTEEMKDEAIKAYYQFSNQLSESGIVYMADINGEGIDEMLYCKILDKNGFEVSNARETLEDAIMFFDFDIDIYAYNAFSGEVEFVTTYNKFNYSGDMNIYVVNNNSLFTYMRGSDFATECVTEFDDQFNRNDSVLHIERDGRKYTYYNNEKIISEDEFFMYWVDLEDIYNVEEGYTPKSDTSIIQDIQVVKFFVNNKEEWYMKYPVLKEIDG